MNLIKTHLVKLLLIFESGSLEKKEIETMFKLNNIPLNQREIKNLFFKKLNIEDNKGHMSNFIIKI